MSESNQLDKTASPELAALATRVAALEKVVAALTANTDIPRRRFAEIGGIERRAGIAPNPTAAPVDFSSIGAKRVR